MFVLFTVLIVSLLVTIALIVSYEAFFDRPTVLAPISLASGAFLILLSSPPDRAWAAGIVVVFLAVGVLAFGARWTFTTRGRLERAYWRKSNREILSSLFDMYSLDERRNRVASEEIRSLLARTLPSDWRDIVGAAARELASVKVTAKRVRSLGISPATTDAYDQTTSIASDHLWLVTERVAAVITDGYSSPAIEERLDAERDKVERLMNATRNAREALAELTLGDIGGGDLEGIELQMRALTSATKELEIV